MVTRGEESEKIRSEPQHFHVAFDLPKWKKVVQGTDLTDMDELPELHDLWGYNALSYLMRTDHESEALFES